MVQRRPLGGDAFGRSALADREGPAHLHRVAVQVIGMISTFVTAFWGMLMNFNLSIIPL